MRVLVFLGALALSSVVAGAAIFGGGVVYADPAGRLAPQTAPVAPAATTTAAEIEVMPLEEAVAVVTAMNKEHAVQVFDELSAAKAAEMMGAMGVAKASEIWGDMKPASAGLVMEDVPTITAIGIVELVSEERLVARLPEISPQKLWEMPVGLLLDKLPSVDAMHLNI